MSISKFILLPELKLLECDPWRGTALCESKRTEAACPHCLTVSVTGYDRRRVTLKDVPLNGEAGSKPIRLTVIKRRFHCKPCNKVFSERNPGVLPYRRSTERFKQLVMWACERFGGLKQVSTDYRVSSNFVYRAFYEQLELKRRRDNQYAWPEAIGIDEHGFGRDKTRSVGSRAFVTMIVNHNRKKLMEVAFGKRTSDLMARLAHIPGRENVRYVTLDLADSYRSFAVSFFPNAQLIADKFHVIRLLSPIIMKERRIIVGKNADRRARSLLLCSSKSLDYWSILAIKKYLKNHPRLLALWEFKEQLHSLYRCKGYDRAKEALDKMTLHAAMSTEPEIQRLGRTLRYWSKEILNYFAFKLTNARVEGFNNTASLVRRRAYGFRNPNNYRLRLLSACS